MRSAPIPATEPARLLALHRYDAIRERVTSNLDELTELVSVVCGTPVALVSLVDETHQRFWSRVGLDATETSREVAFCAHAILDSAVLEVEDARDDIRFTDNPLVVDGPKIRFYAGAPLETPDGHNIGTLCAIDMRPNRLSATQRRQLRIIANQVVTQLELARRLADVDDLLSQKSALVEQLVLRNDDLAQFAYRTSHDVRGPMIRARRAAEMALDDLEDGAIGEARDNLHRIVSTTSRLSALVGDILALARADLAQDVDATVDLDALLSEIEKTYDEESAAAGVQLRTVGKGATFSCERARIQQIAHNLVSNAVKYADLSKAAPFVEVAAEIADDHLRLVVADNGLGIPCGEEHRVFKMFERLHPNAAEGTGLGMAIVKKHVDALNGRIDFESAPGRGTTFVVEVPVEQVRKIR